MSMETRHDNSEIFNHIDALLQEIYSIKEYPIKGINCLMPIDCSGDVRKVLPPLLIELKEHLNVKEYDSYKFGHFLSTKFEM